jgi:long-subunit fatty acid transport protein
MSWRSRLLRAARLLTVWALAGTAHGQALPQIDIGTSPNPVGSGARALGQGNAFIAVADDATAASWNPAGLTQLELPEWSFAVESYRRREAVSSPSEPEIGGTNRTGLADLNYLSIVYPFYAGSNMAVSLNYMKVYRFDKEVDLRLQQTNANVTLDAQHQFDQVGAFSVVAPAFALDLTDRLSLGVTLNAWSHDITGASRYDKTEITSGSATIDPGIGPPVTIPLAGRRVTESFEVDSGYSLALGGLYRLSEAWQIGFVLKPEYELEVSRDNATNTAAGPTREQRWQLPTIAGLGLSYRPRDAWQFAVDASWTQWSRYQVEEGGTTTSPITGGPKRLSSADDTVTVRLGVEYLIVREDYLVPLRAGLGYDPTPADGGSDDYYTASLGTGLQVGPVNVDIAYELRWGRNVNRSTFQSVDGRSDIRQHRLLLSMIYYF